MADRLAGGNLADRLTELRGEDRSFEQIARDLHNEFGVEVTAETVRKWSRQLGIEPTARAAS